MRQTSPPSTSACPPTTAISWAHQPHSRSGVLATGGKREAPWHLHKRNPLLSFLTSPLRVDSIMHGPARRLAEDGGDAQPFCAMSGTTGSTMYNGFTYMPQLVNGYPNYCLVFLYERWVANTPGRYALAIFGAFLIAFGTEGFRCARNCMRQYRPCRAKAPVRGLVIYTAVDSVLLAIQLALAYAAMLLVMSYELLIIFGVICGLVVGHLLSEACLVCLARRAVKDGVAPPRGLVGGTTPCCDPGLEILDEDGIERQAKEDELSFNKR